MSANSEVLALVQTNPEIGTSNASYVSRLVDTAIEFVMGYCNLPAFPVLSQGYSKSRAGAATNLTALSTNRIDVSVNGSGYTEVDLTLANCTTGAATAAELQARIQQLDLDSSYEPGGVVVAYADTCYTITSPLFGEQSRINVAYDADYKHVAEAMRLSPNYGGTEEPGMASDSGLIRAAALLVEHMYNRLGIEGAANAGLPDDISLTDSDIEPRVKQLLLSRRRMWT